MKLKLCVLAFFFCLMAAMGIISISDTQKPVPLPVDGAFSIQGKSSLSNNEIYHLITDLSKTKKVDIYKPIFQSSGQLIYVNFNDPDYEQLKTVPITGMYYTLGKIDSDSLAPLTTTGLQTVYVTYPWYIGGLLQFSGNLRPMLMLSIYLTLLVVLFVIRTRKMKEGVIRRSLGLPVYDLRKDYLYSFLFELAMIVALMSFYSYFWGEGLLTYSSRLFFSMLLTNLVLFQIIDSITVLLFWLTIKVEKPIEIIKNKAKNRLIFVVWLVVISIIIMVSGFFLQETRISQSSINVQITNLEPWKKVENWQRLELLGLEQKSIHNEEAEDLDALSDRYVQLAAHLKGLDFLYIGSSGAYIPDYLNSPEFSRDFLEQLKTDGITHPEVNKELLYINQTGANVQNSVNGTDYQVLEDKIATIYIPDKFKESRQSIENTVVAEQFTGTNYTKENLTVKIIPDGNKIFYFNESGDNNQKNQDILPLTSATDSETNIVVVLDTDKMIANKDVSLASNIINNSLFSPEAIKKMNELTAESNFSINPVDVYQTVKLNVQSLEHQIFLSKILQKIIYCIVFLLIYQYIQMFIVSKQNDYVKKIILGLSKTRIALASLQYFILTLTVVIVYTWIKTKQVELVYIGVTSLVILLVSTIMSFKKLSEKYTQILKGDEQ